MNKLNASQVEKLIEFIKKKPVIFDKNDKFYKHVSMKEKVWREVSKLVGAEESECKTAWKSLRDQFVKAARELKEKPEGLEKKTYKYYEQLLFLKDSIRARKRRPSSNYDQLNEESDFPLEEHEMFYKNDPEISSDKTRVPLLFDTTARSTPSPGPSKKLKLDPKDDEQPFLEFLEIKSLNKNQTKQEDMQNFFAIIASMVTNAQLTRFENRQIQRKVFNFVADELDKLDNDGK